jgi:hypothetical protein
MQRHGEAQLLLGEEQQISSGFCLPKERKNKLNGVVEITNDTSSTVNAKIFNNLGYTTCFDH